MSIDHGKLLTLGSIPALPDQWDTRDGYMHGWNDCLRALAQPAEAAKDCLRVPPGNGFCDQCAAGNYAQCRYIAQPAEAVNPDLCPACKTWPVDLDVCPNCGLSKPFPDIDKLAESADGLSIESPEAKAYYAAIEARRAVKPAESVESIAGKFHREVLDPLLSAHHLSASNADDAAQGAVAPFGWLHEIKWTDGWGSPKYVHGPDKPKPHIEQCDADMRHLVEPLVDGERFTPLYAHPQAAPAQGASLRHTNPHLTKESVERNVRSSSALEGISTKTFQAASAGDEE